MNNLNNKKKNNSKVTTRATFLLLAAILVVAGVSTPLAITTHVLQSAQAQRFIETGTELGPTANAPAIVSGDNIYIAWWTNNTENGNEEVMFIASSDGGAIFSNKTNLSNSADANSWRVEIAGEGDNVVVSWWETNQTSDIPVARISTDAGATFGPLIRLEANGNIDSTAEEEVAAEAGEL